MSNHVFVDGWEPQTITRWLSVTLKKSFEFDDETAWSAAYICTKILCIVFTRGKTYINKSAFGIVSVPATLHFARLYLGYRYYVVIDSILSYGSLVRSTMLNNLQVDISGFPLFVGVGHSMYEWDITCTWVHSVYAVLLNCNLSMQKCCKIFQDQWRVLPPAYGHFLLGELPV